MLLFTVWATRDGTSNEKTNFLDFLGVGGALIPRQNFSILGIEVAHVEVPSLVAQTVPCENRNWNKSSKSCKNRYWKLVKNDSDDISSDFQYFHFFIFRRKNSKIRKHVFENFAIFYLKFPSTQSKSFFRKFIDFWNILWREEFGKF